MDYERDYRIIIRSGAPELLLRDVGWAEPVNFEPDLALKLGLSNEQQQLPGPGRAQKEWQRQVVVAAEEEANCEENNPVNKRTPQLTFARSWL